MRQWNLWPAVLCRAHLLGEHKELHMLRGALDRGKSIAGHVARHQLNPATAEERHSALVSEFRARGWPSGLNHQTPLSMPLWRGEATINSAANAVDLAMRCPACRDRMAAAAGCVFQTHNVEMP